MTAEDVFFAFPMAVLDVERGRSNDYSDEARITCSDLKATRTSATIETINFDYELITRIDNTVTDGGILAAVDTMDKSILRKIMRKETNNRYIFPCSNTNNRRLGESQRALDMTLSNYAYGMSSDQPDAIDEGRKNQGCVNRYTVPEDEEASSFVCTPINGHLEMWHADGGDTTLDDEVPSYEELRSSTLRMIKNAMENEKFNDDDIIGTNFIGVRQAADDAAMPGIVQRISNNDKPDNEAATSANESNKLSLEFDWLLVVAFCMIVVIAVVARSYVKTRRLMNEKDASDDISIGDNEDSFGSTNEKYRSTPPLSIT